MTLSSNSVRARVVYKIPYRRALGRVRRASKGILHTRVRVRVRFGLG